MDTLIAIGIAYFWKPVQKFNSFHSHAKVSDEIVI